MTGRKLLLSVLFFMLFLSFQILLGRNMSLFGLAFCFVYVGAFLFLPIETPQSIVMLVALGTGLIVDMFYNSPGMHACAAVGIAYLRFFVLRSLQPDGGYESYMEISAAYLGIRWLLFFLAPLLFTHSFILFSIEFGGFNHIFMILTQATLSTIFNMALLLLAQYAIYWPGSRSI